MGGNSCLKNVSRGVVIPLKPKTCLTLISWQALRLTVPWSLVSLRCSSRPRVLMPTQLSLNLHKDFLPPASHEAPLIGSVVLVQWAVISVASAHAFDSTGIAAAFEIPIYILPCTTHSHGLCVFQQPPLGLPPCSLQTFTTNTGNMVRSFRPLLMTPTILFFCPPARMPQCFP